MKLSIITINKNNAQGLERTIKSVINQTFKDLEYIIIDGGSTDKSLDIIKKYQDKINYWISEPDTGIFNAMNKGIKIATGEYLLFLNSGDFLIDSKVLEKIPLSKFQEQIIYGGIMVNNKYEKHFTDDLTLYFFVKNSLPHCATFIHKKLFEKFGYYDENLKISSDWKFFTEAIIIHNTSFRRINQIISAFFTDGISSKNIEEVRKEKDKVLQTLFPRIYPDYKKLITIERELKIYKSSRFVKYYFKFKNVFKSILDIFRQIF